MGEGGGFESKALYFCGGGGVLFFFVFFCLFFFFFFQSSGRLAFEKMYHFLQVMVLLKNAILWVSFVEMGSFGMKKKKK